MPARVMHSSDVVRIENLLVECVVGVYPHERNATQPLSVDAELFFDSQPAAETERVRDTANYHAIASQIVFVLRSGHFRLLETAAHVLAKMLLAPPAPGERRPQIDALKLRLEKPGALPGHALPSLAIERDKAWVSLGHETKPFGTVDVIHETTTAGFYRLNIEAGREIPLHRHLVMRESEMTLSKGLLVNGRSVKPGTVFRWPIGAKHRYENPTDRTQTVLCVDMPKFEPDDEQEVGGEPDLVDPEPSWGPAIP